MPLDSMHMDPAVFERFRRLIYDASGIALRENKVQLLKARIRKRMNELNIKDCGRYLEYVEADESDEELVRLLDAVSTNVTSFFREQRHFDVIAEWIREALAAGRRRFRFWSAACSSGEEPVTLAMVVDQACTGYDVDWKILATDISSRMLIRAQEGLYPEAKATGIPAHLRQRYFTHATVEGHDFLQVREMIARRIVYRRVNLSDPPFPLKGPLDVVMCRNVMIYFDDLVRRRLLSDIYRLVDNEGLFVVGHAESLTGMLSEFKSVVPSVYCKQSNALVSAAARRCYGDRVA